MDHAMNARLMRTAWRLALAACAGPWAVEAPAAVRYVSPSGLHQPPFETWTDAATNIQAAVDAAGMGDVVLVTNGTYAPFVGIETVFMTASNVPAPTVVTASAHFNSSYEGWRAFSSNGFWALPVGAAPQWIVYDSGVAGGLEIDSYQLICPDRTSGDQSVSGWEIQVSEDGISWASIDSRSEALTEDVHYYYETAQPATARYVRVDIHAVRDPANGATLRMAFGHSLVVTSVNGAAETIIDGQGGAGVWLGTARLEEFQITGATGYGVFLGDIRHCVVSSNVGSGISWARRVEQCEIARNTEYGAANVYVLERSVIENNDRSGVYNCHQTDRCLIQGNGALSGNGGGVYLQGVAGAGGIVSSCTIVSNLAVSGAGVYTTSGMVHNCFLSGNTASYRGGGVYALNGVGRVVNCTVVNNAAAERGGGIYWAVVYNSIVVDNLGVAGHSNHSAATFSYSCAMPLPVGAGNIAEPPGLISVNSPHVALASPCVDAGSLALAAGDFDIDGEPRIWGDGVDIGCDEVYSPGLTGALAVVLSANFSRAVVNYPVQFDHAVLGKAEGFLLSFGDGQVVTNAPSVIHGFGAAGLYPVVLTAWNLDGSASATTTVEVFDGYTNYVSLSGGHLWPFTNEPDAATDIPAAISANIPGGVVIVADGTYDQGGVLVTGALTNRIALTNAVTVRSMNGPGGAIVAGRGPAGPAAVRCAYIGSGSRLEGFTLTNGCTLAGGAEAETHGGGAWLASGGVMSNCVVSGNRASGGGGGLRGGEIWDSLLSGNTAAQGGGALGGMVHNSRILANTVSSNGGGALGGALRNCLVADNRARYGGGTAWSTNTHCTLTRNEAGLYGGGAYRSYAVHCVIFHNAASNDWPEYFNSICDFTCTRPDPAGTGNVTNDPQFVDLIGGDFRLLEGSPAVDAALGGGSPAADLDGVPRPLDGNDDGAAAPDMGAFETIHASADTDGDGLGDSNEYYSVGTSPVLRDTDGDDQSDGDELIAGFDPLDIDSFFAILRVSPPRSTVAAFYWPGATGRLYTLRVTPSLEQEFTNLPEYVDQPGFDGTMGFTNPVPSSMEFFGVSVRLGP